MVGRKRSIAKTRHGIVESRRCRNTNVYANNRLVSVAGLLSKGLHTFILQLHLGHGWTKNQLGHEPRTSLWDFATLQPIGLSWSNIIRGGNVLVTSQSPRTNSAWPRVPGHRCQLVSLMASSRTIPSCFGGQGGHLWKRQLKATHTMPSCCCGYEALAVWSKAKWCAASGTPRSMLQCPWTGSYIIVCISMYWWVENWSLIGPEQLGNWSLVRLRISRYTVVYSGYY